MQLFASFDTRLFIIFIFAISFSEQSDIYEIVIATLIKDYFQHKIIRQLVFFGCWDPYERVKFSQSIIHLNRYNYLTYVNIQNDLNMNDILKVNYYKLGIFLDLDCQQSKIIFDQFSEQRLRHNESYFWLMKYSQQSVPHYFYDLPLNIAVEMTLATKNINDDGNYLLHDVYNPSYRHGGKLNVTFMGDWSFSKGLDIKLTQYKYRRRGNLHGLVLNSSIVITNPSVSDFHSYIQNVTDRHHDTMHRYNYALTLQLRDYYNFKIHLTKSKTWGYLENGTFNGIIGEMLKGIVDFSTSPFQLKPERFDVTEFTVHTLIARPCFIFRHPQKNDMNNAFSKPLEDDAWFGIFIIGMLLWLLLYLEVKVEHKLDQHVPSNSLDTNPLSETALIASAAICQQGLSDGPRFLSGRIIFMSLFLWALLLYQFYSASIVGSLLAEKPRWIKTLKDLAESNLEIGIEDIAYNSDFFATTTNPVAIKLYNEKIAENKKRRKLPYYTPEEGLMKVKAGGFAFHVDVATAYKIIEETFDVDEICELAEIELFPPLRVGTITSRHSPFKKMISYGMRQIVEKGMANRLEKVWVHRKPSCPESRSEEPVPVVLSDFSPALVALICGCFCAAMVMVVEIVIHLRKNSKLGSSFFNIQPRKSSSTFLPRVPPKRFILK